MAKKQEITTKINVKTISYKDTVCVIKMCIVHIGLYDSHCDSVAYQQVFLHTYFIRSVEV